MLQSRCIGCAPRQADSCWFSGLDLTKVTSTFDELRIQGDQPHRGLCLAPRGNPGDQPHRGVPSSAAWRDPESQWTF